MCALDATTNQGGCFVAIDVPVSSGSGNGTGVININGSNTVSRLGGEDWSRSTYDFNATVGVACIVAAVVVVCAMVMAVLCSRKQPKDQVHEATSIQATRQIRRDVQVRSNRCMPYEFNIMPLTKSSRGLA